MISDKQIFERYEKVRSSGKYNMITDWGKLMDPLADKITQISSGIIIVKKSLIQTHIVSIKINMYINIRNKIS